MKLFKSFTALKALSIPVLLCACGIGSGWVRPDYDLSKVPRRAPAQDGVLTHSHNDYEQKNPLMDALSLGFDSVEADVWLRGRRLLVSHMGWSAKGTLNELYLDPLQKLVDERGSVYGDHKTFFLWVDIKRYEAGLADLLKEVFSRYPMLSGAPGRERAVIIVLTGSERAKTEFMKGKGTHLATRDSHRFHGGDPPGDGSWSWYSLKWSDLFRWEGRGPMPSEEWRRLQDLVRKIHEKGRRIRFWAVPQTPQFWATAVEAGVDTLQTDSLTKLREVLSGMKRSPASIAENKEPERAEPPAALRLLTR